MAQRRCIKCHCCRIYAYIGPLGTESVITVGERVCVYLTAESCTGDRLSFHTDYAILGVTFDRDQWSQSAVDDVTIIDHFARWSRQALLANFVWWGITFSWREWSPPPSPCLATSLQKVHQLTTLSISADSLLYTLLICTQNNGLTNATERRLSTL